MARSAAGRVTLNRRAFIGATIAGGLALAACGRSTIQPTTSSSALAAAITAAEAAEHCRCPPMAARDPGSHSAGWPSLSGGEAAASAAAAK